MNNPNLPPRPPFNGPSKLPVPPNSSSPTPNHPPQSQPLVNPFPPNSTPVTPPAHQVNPNPTGQRNPFPQQTQGPTQQQPPQGHRNPQNALQQDRMVSPPPTQSNLNQGFTGQNRQPSGPPQNMNPTPNMGPGNAGRDFGPPRFGGNNPIDPRNNQPGSQQMRPTGPQNMNPNMGPQGQRPQNQLNHTSQAAKKPVVLIIIMAVLFFALAGVGVYAVTLNTQVAEAKRQAEQEFREKQVIELEKETLQEKVDAKEEFSAAMGSLMSELAYFNGAQYAGKIPVTYIDGLVQEAYNSRESPTYVDLVTADVQALTEELKVVRETWESQKGNSTGNSWEAVLDTLSKGYTVTVMYDYNNNVCSLASSGCVFSANPHVVNLNVDELNQAVNYWGADRGNWWFTGVTYHEYAHVMQFTNWNITEKYIATFGGDHELMADCYTDVYYDGGFSSQSYNRGCSDEQKGAVQAWFNEITFVTPTFTQKDPVI